ncbi:hypothetical protein MASR2M12_19400 [Bacteroidales bacterium]
MDHSCSKRVEPIKTITYIYKNKSGIDLDIEVYNEGDRFKIFSLSTNMEVETNTIRDEGPVPFLFYEPTMKYGDSVVIRFSNNHCLSYSRKSGSGSLGDKIFDYRKYDNYSPDLVEQSKYTLYYTITVDDYNESVVCE